MNRKKDLQVINRATAASFIDEVGDLYLLFTRAGEKSEQNRIMAETLKSIFDEHGIAPPEPCNGDAHSNAFIDHCGVCMPHWGKIYRNVKVK